MGGGTRSTFWGRVGDRADLIPLHSDERSHCAGLKSWLHSHHDVQVSVAEVKARLDSNLKRVQGLIQLSSVVEPRAAPTKTDLLRAAVVFLHATLEDALRTGLRLRLPQASPEHLTMLDFAVGDTTKEKITIGQLAQHRGKTVDQLLKERINAYLDRSNFNNVAEVKVALERMGCSRSVLDPHRDLLAVMMIRRHWIVHRADHNEGAAGPGRQRTRPLGANVVASWKETVASFCSTLLAQLERS